MLQFYCVLSAIADFCVIYFGNCINSIWDIWKPAILFVVFLAVLLATHLGLFVLWSLAVDKDKRVTDIHNSHRRFMLVSLHLFFQLVRVKVHVRGAEKIPDDGKFLFVGNHISSYDPLITLLTLRKKNLAFVSKKENLQVKFAGAYIHKAGCIGLDRENNREAVKAINAAAQNITEGVCAMGIYPEGWVNKTVEGLLPFRNGAFKIAQKAKVPMVIATIANTRKIEPNIKKLRRTDVYLEIVDVIPYENFAELKTNEIGNTVYDIMLNALNKYKSGELNV